MDQTLVSYNGLLRPHAVEVIDRLRSESHLIHIWSGVGDRTEDVRALDLMDRVEGVYIKPTERFERRLKELQIPIQPDVVVDDHEDIVDHFGGILVWPYFWPDETDTELCRAYKRIIEIGQQKEDHFRHLR